MRHFLTSSHYCVDPFYDILDDDAHVKRKILRRHFRGTQNMTFDHIFMVRFLTHFNDKSCKFHVLKKLQRRNSYLRTNQGFDMS